MVTKIDILVVDTTYPINTRTKRFVDSFNYSAMNVHVVAWNRGKGTIPSGDKQHIFNTNIGYGQKLKKLCCLWMFLIYFAKITLKLKPKVIFLSHWDSLLIGVLVKFILMSEVKIIYDCLDLPTVNNKAFMFVLNKLEKILAKKSDLIIFASRFFPEKYAVDSNKFIVFENYISADIVNNARGINSKKLLNPVIPAMILELRKIKNTKIISWIGVVRYFDVIKNIVKAVSKNDNFYFCVFGDGPDLDKLKIYCEERKFDRVYFFGRYSVDMLPYIYNVTDVVWAAYPSNDINVKYAISNKYFECSFFRKKPIFSKKTKIAEQLKNENAQCIFIDEYSVDDISEKLSQHLNNQGAKVIDPYEKKLFWDKEFIEASVIIRKILNK